jgi:hypothetical protein
VSNDNTSGIARGAQLELFGAEPLADTAPNAEQMRGWLIGVLTEAKAARTMPWPPVKAELYRLMFPQLTFWLPEDEGAQLRFEFDTELARLKAA